MTPQIVLSFLSFVALSGITPGPANLTSLATSLTYGKNSALRQWVGLISGCITDAMISVLIAYFLGTALNEYVKYLAFVGVAYLMWMAFHMLPFKKTTSEFPQAEYDQAYEALIPENYTIRFLLHGNG